jgi:cbb3-type cytochrome oxidase cytochrome c subunit
MNRAGIICFAAVSVFLILIVFSFPETRSRGKALFVREGCIGCHSFKGEGGMGHDLTSAGHRRSTLWIMSQLKDPKKHNPDSRMPEYSHLSVLDRYALARYIRA